MKKLIKLFIFSIISIILSSCANYNNDALNDLIQTPKQDAPIIEGTWKVVEIKSTSYGEETTATNLGDYLYINKNLVAINNSYAFPPSFNSKYVKLSDNMKNRGIEIPKRFKDRNVVVINASQGQLFSRDFIVTDDNYLFFIKDDNIISCKRIDDKVDPKIQDSYAKLASKERTTTTEGEEIAEDLSLLLGVRERIDPNSEDALYKYYTYLIRIEDDDSIKYQKAEDIFIKNQDEYWQITLDLNNITNLYDEIKAYPIKIKDKDDSEVLLKNYTFNDINLNMRLNFVSNGFISIDYTDTNDENPVRKYALMDTNNIADNKFMSLQEFTGEDQSDSIFREKIKEEINNTFQKTNFDDFSVDNTNFGIVRNQGIWEFQSSISMGSGDEFMQNFFNFDIAIGDSMLNPNNSIITRDQVYNINTQFKDYLVMANQRYVLIQTPDEILIHRIKDGIIEKAPVYAIATRMPATVISIDQFLGSNAIDVEKAFEKYNTIIEK